MKLRAIILGCGSSGGVPRIGGTDGQGAWGACDPTNPKNIRSRCSAVIQRAHPDGSFDQNCTTLLIDCAPEMRLQLIRAGIGHVDAVAITHNHADQTHGIDDLRAIAINRMQRVKVLVSEATSPELRNRFRYLFEQKEGSAYPPVLEWIDLPPDGETVQIEGGSGPLPLMPFLQRHGQVDSHGFRCGPIAYSADLNDLDEASWPMIDGIKLWIIDALQYIPHGSHLHLEKSLEFLERAGCESGILTNLHVVMDYAIVGEETPAHIVPAYDNLIIEAEL